LLAVLGLAVALVAWPSIAQPTPGALRTGSLQGDPGLSVVTAGRGLATGLPADRVSCDADLQDRRALLVSRTRWRSPSAVMRLGLKPCAVRPKPREPSPERSGRCCVAVPATGPGIVSNQSGSFPLDL
jgi:hypothetical protein